MYPGIFAESHPNKLALIMSDTGESMTYEELHSYAEKVANLLQNAGFEPGDHIALCLENRLEFLPICWGAHYAGLYYTAISSRLTAPEIEYIIKDCEARAFITSPYKGAEAQELASEIPDVSLRLSVGGSIEGFVAIEDLLEQQPLNPIGPRIEGADMLYSSGTTGRPKGIKVPLPGTPLGETDGVTALLGGLFGASPESNYLSPAPLYHAAPLRFCRGIHKIGGTVVVMPRFSPEEMLDSIEEYKISFLQVVPTMFVRLLKLDQSVRDAANVTSLQAVVHAAAPCPIPVKKQMIEWWGPLSMNIMLELREMVSAIVIASNGLSTRGPLELLSRASFISLMTAEKNYRLGKSERFISKVIQPSSTTMTKRKRKAHALQMAGLLSAISVASMQKDTFTSRIERLL